MRSLNERNLIPYTGAACIPPLSAPDGGRMTCSDGYSVGSECKFTCDTGYSMQGDSSVTCQSDGQWSASRPCCKGEAAFRWQTTDKIVGGRLCIKMHHFQTSIQTSVHPSRGWTWSLFSTVRAVLERITSKISRTLCWRSVCRTNDCGTEFAFRLLFDSTVNCIIHGRIHRTYVER